jgi:hypothetical protein
VSDGKEGKATKKPVYAHDMIREWLEKHGYDGLYHEDEPCGCRKDDLCPCESSPQFCLPGYAHENEHGRYCGIRPKPQAAPDKRLDERRDDET